ncbi:GFP-like fluorescent chromoprotein amFP486 [Stylophora pistillata]|uniref:GFP-like fluorescent chromoprotein amFP486 n=1 Tax=Stylophora pistillata TaxID=50429 RepID=UPI000C03C9FF|nr:GFP-like fluorescent chromoprotein amFP486 [Stylophora pistillata]
MSHSKQGITKDMTMKYKMEGCVNGHPFTIRGNGNGNPYESMFHGVNFPADGPIMKKETTGWDPSFEKMTVSEGLLKGDVTMFLVLKGGGYHKCQFHTTYKTKQPVTLPPNHVVEHRILRTGDGDKINLVETAEAHVNPL